MLFLEKGGIPMAGRKPKPMALKNPKVVKYVFNTSLLIRINDNCIIYKNAESAKNYNNAIDLVGLF